MTTRKTIFLEPIGKRIARLRNARGWTQQRLAERLAISRVAVSHIEMDLTFPSERTLTLLAGLFKLSPDELVNASTYPPAKAERLPQVVCSYTQLEVALALLENDLAWFERLFVNKDDWRLAHEINQKWNERLDKLAGQSLDPEEKQQIAAARKKLAAACQQAYSGKV